ncbi:MAG: 4-hydroxythreonine-4-phosphate dehydrogenase PdxA [Limisphaerales bacterium]
MIGISCGDVTGIGLEVTLKALAALASRDESRYLLVGDWKRLCYLNKQFGVNLPLQFFENKNQKGRFFVHDPLPESLPPELEQGGAASARAAIAWLTEAAQRCLRKEISAMVTAPLNKKAVLRTDRSFVGQTEFLSELAGTNRTAMMLLGHDEKGRWLRVALATTHLPIKQVAAKLTQEKIELAIELAAQACRDLALSQARVGVCGLNPHAGEGGELGAEEGEIISPAIEAAAKKNINVTGPWPADTLFHYAYRGDYEAIVAMYHDQGLVPLKMIGFETGVNWTLGLPFVRTSPDHGTAYDIAGQGKANPSSMIEAIELAKNLGERRR